LKTALILSGGGAKGPYEIGFIKALCENNEYKNSWDSI